MIRVVLFVLALIVVSTSVVWAQSVETPDDPGDHAAHHLSQAAVAETEEPLATPNVMPHTWQDMMSMMPGMNPMMQWHMADMPPMMAHVMSMMGAMGHRGQAGISRYMMPERMRGSEALGAGCINTHGGA